MEHWVDRRIVEIDEMAFDMVSHKLRREFYQRAKSRRLHTAIPKLFPGSIDYSKPCRQWPDDLLHWSTHRLCETFDMEGYLRNKTTVHPLKIYAYLKSRRLHKFVFGSR